MKRETQSIPEFTEAQYRYLQRVFQRKDIDPSVDTKEIMYSAGEQNVLRHIKTKVIGWTTPNYE